MKYRRLQVGPIWLRTLIEIALLLLAFIVCSSMVVSYYEATYFETTQAQAAESNAQLAHTIQPAIDVDLIMLEDKERSEFARDHYFEPLLNSSFIPGDVLNSGAIYTLADGSANIYAVSDNFPTAITGDITAVVDTVLRDGYATLSSEKSNTSVLPVSDDLGNVRALLVVHSEYRDSLDYNSIVSTRMNTIAIVCGGIIIIYYVISGIVSAKNKKKGAQVE